jgi:hypothetical protein
MALKGLDTNISILPSLEFYYLFNGVCFIKHHQIWSGIYQLLNVGIQQLQRCNWKYAKYGL